MLITNGGAAQPFWGHCAEPKHLIAGCLKAPAEWWTGLDTSKMVWNRVDKNTHCLTIKL